jgi:hypothetical protein
MTSHEHMYCFMDKWVSEYELDMHALRKYDEQQKKLANKFKKDPAIVEAVKHIESRKRQLKALRKLKHNEE